MTIEERADKWAKEMGLEKAIADLNNEIFVKENSFGKVGYTADDLRYVKERKAMVKYLSEKK